MGPCSPTSLLPGQTVAVCLLQSRFEGNHGSMLTDQPTTRPNGGRMPAAEQIRRKGKPWVYGYCQATTRPNGSTVAMKIKVLGFMCYCTHQWPWVYSHRQAYSQGERWPYAVCLLQSHFNGFGPGYGENLRSPNGAPTAPTERPREGLSNEPTHSRNGLQMPPVHPF
ncbi:hypothetical protein B0H16DRAFT_1465947 [Mycena metata]|uniref:Uncharacterized protein n=1 Tax=Mycena metata TaxID=1033252 RepID=A0AAD7IBP2_9AGAR|nr:hypothetical protein B0H16DRAFT_1465947 [Mycena metata]